MKLTHSTYAFDIVRGRANIAASHAEEWLFRYLRNTVTRHQKLSNNEIVLGILTLLQSSSYPFQER